MEELILAIDQGTTNTKALLIGKDGRSVYRTSTSVELLTPLPGYVEQEPEVLWRSVCEVIKDCEANLGSRRIVGIAISNQRETALAWSRSTGLSLSNAISWQCRRSIEVCERLSPASKIIREKTGLPLDPLVSASKWSWLLLHNPNVAALGSRGDLCLGNVDSWLIHKLSGGRVHATDHTNASRTALLNLNSREWDAELLGMFGIPPDALPHIVPSLSIIGTVESIPSLMGTPIVSAIGDSHAAMAGHGSYRPGTMKATYGTGSSLMMLTPAIPPPTSSLARTIAWSTKKSVQFALEGNVTMTGAAVQWVGQFLKLKNPTEDTIALANSVSDSGGVVFVPAMVGLGAPYWKASVRGTITGLGHSATSAHLARAAVESIAFQVADVFHEMRRAGGVDVSTLHADGGATRNSTLMQFQSDLLGVPVCRSACEDLSAMGAAWLGGITLGWWQDFSSLQALPESHSVFSPADLPGDQYKDWKHAIAQTLLEKSAR
jgi:glycerol kinase